MSGSVLQQGGGMWGAGFKVVVLGFRGQVLRVSV